MLVLGVVSEEAAPGMAGVVVAFALLAVVLVAVPVGLRIARRRRERHRRAAAESAAPGLRWAGAPASHERAAVRRAAAALAGARGLEGPLRIEFVGRAEPQDGEEARAVVRIVAGGSPA